MRDKEIRIKHHVVTCDCGYVERIEEEGWATRAARQRAALLLAMTHNTQRHSYGYKIQGGSS